MSQYRKGSVLKNGLGMIGRIGLITAGIIGLYLSLGFAFVQAEELNIDLVADTYVARRAAAAVCTSK